MCAILDANVKHQVFGVNPSPAGKKFLDWVDSGKGKLVVGGKLRKELDGKVFRKWLQSAILSGTAKNVDDERVDEKTRRLRKENSCKSNDHHVIALAQLGGARLLYSNDTKLRADFRELVSGGRVYSTAIGGEFSRTHKKLLRENVCPD